MDEFIAKVKNPDARFYGWFLCTNSSHTSLHGNVRFGFPELKGDGWVFKETASQVDIYDAEFRKYPCITTILTWWK